MQNCTIRHWKFGSYNPFIHFTWLYGHLLERTLYADNDFFIDTYSTMNISTLKYYFVKLIFLFCTSIITFSINVCILYIYVYCVFSTLYIDSYSNRYISFLYFPFIFILSFLFHLDHLMYCEVLCVGFIMYIFLVFLGKICKFIIFWKTLLLICPKQYLFDSVCKVSTS